ncbi:TetR/AcrR family transcriptional regulator [Lactiplantibacillus garii]|uniref:TetR/AcrR family transcriptional regulator n=1 Tax=Lactiplantibacillus garii TaxID=2306423 RepID=A0A426D653_9LACO|nr:TetR/AcrR family transcriptional regulator [Lactiplantibacillus garii]RRK10105.1 TetR/AcrR family transcriptional regulator [Lactiplantibacillus garii]
MEQHPRIRDYFSQDLADNRDITPKQRAILQASLDLFAEKGFEQTSTSDIAQRAGVAEGTVYRRYRTKEGLRDAILAPLATNIAPMLASDFSKDELHRRYPSLEAFLTAIYDDRVAFVLANQKEIKVILEMVAFDQARRNQIIGHIAPVMVQQFGGVLNQLRADQLLVPWPNDLIIQTILSMIGGELMRGALTLPNDDPQRERTYVLGVLGKLLTPSATDDPALTQL